MWLVRSPLSQELFGDGSGQAHASSPSMGCAGARFDATQKDFALSIEAHNNEGRIHEASLPEASLNEDEIEDDCLRLIFTCCHPALPPEGQLPLTLPRSLRPD